MDKEKLKTWLTTEGKDRQWLADQLGCSKGTVDQWFSRGFPDWAIKSIERLLSPRAAISQSGGLEVTFSAREFERIEAARNLLGLPTRKLYYESAINEFTDQILSQEAMQTTERDITVAGHPLKIIQPAHYSSSPESLKVAETTPPTAVDAHLAEAARQFVADPQAQAAAARTAPPAPSPAAAPRSGGAPPHPSSHAPARPSTES